MVAVTPDHFLLNQAEKHLENAEAFMQADESQARDEMIRADELLTAVATFERLRHPDTQDGEQARRCVDLRVRWHELKRKFR